MAFLEEELRNFSAKGWQSVLGTGNRSGPPDNLAVYEETATNAISVNGENVLIELNNIPVAGNMTEADANAVLFPNLIETHNNTNAIHLTPTPNNKAFFATEVYGDITTRMFNWIMPQQVQYPNGFASIGYTIRLYQGDPNAGGVEIPTSIEKVGATVAWTTMYGAGAIVVASNFSAITNPSDVWMTGYRYIGKTAGDAAGTLHTYSREFTNTDLFGGYLTVLHNLHARYKVCNVTIMDENSRQIDLDDIYFQTLDILIIDFRTIEPIPGTWSLVVTTDVIDNIIPPIINKHRYINGSFINGTQLN